MTLVKLATQVVRAKLVTPVPMESQDELVPLDPKEAKEAMVMQVPQVRQVRRARLEMKERSVCQVPLVPLVNRDFPEKSAKQGFMVLKAKLDQPALWVQQV